jgi:hypothetical protein
MFEESRENLPRKKGGSVGGEAVGTRWDAANCQ